VKNKRFYGWAKRLALGYLLSVQKINVPFLEGRRGHFSLLHSADLLGCIILRLFFILLEGEALRPLSIRSGSLCPPLMNETRICDLVWCWRLWFSSRAISSFRCLGPHFDLQIFDVSGTMACQRYSKSKPWIPVSSKVLQSRSLQSFSVLSQSAVALFAHRNIIHQDALRVGSLANLGLIEPLGFRLVNNQLFHRLFYLVEVFSCKFLYGMGLCHDTNFDWTNDSAV
jgi:hypothetical protein